MQLNNQTNPASIRPQNLSCPAGGTNTAQSKPKARSNGQRGVIVAPPSGNTSGPDGYEVLHRGFDTLALAIKAHIGTSLDETLQQAKERGEIERRDIEVNYRGITVLLKPYGGKGYAFIADGGPDGATWFFKKPNAKDPWGIRVSFGSFFLAIYGLGAAKAHCEHILDSFGIRYGPSDVSLSRADFCVDILAPAFALIPDSFVMHSSTSRRDYVTAEDLAINGKSGRVTSVTIGTPSNRQVIIYDKYAEITAKGKSHWWGIWNSYLRTNADTCAQEPSCVATSLNKSDQGRPIVPKCADHAAPHVATSRGNSAKNSPHVRKCAHNSPQNEPTCAANTPHQSAPIVLNSAHKYPIWRIEFRAGKNQLKTRWNIRTWSDFFARFGDLCCEMGEVIKYTNPSQSDPNRARWPIHPIWALACAQINDDLFELRSNADPNPLKEVHREDHIALIIRNILGCAITVAALNDTTQADLPASIDSLAKDLKAKIKADPERTERQLREAKERYVFVKRPEG